MDTTFLGQTKSVTGHESKTTLMTIEDPYPNLHQLRMRSPMLFIPDISTWWLTRYAEVSAGLRDKRFLINTPYLPEDAPITKIFKNFILFIDPPRHKQLRSILSPVFEPKAMGRLEGYIAKRTDDLIKNMRQQAKPDIIRDVALPLPISIICEILGIPHDDVPLLQVWVKDLEQALDSAEYKNTPQIDKSVAEFVNYLRIHIENTRKTPQNNAFLAQALAANEKQLSSDELIAHYIMMFGAGFETTMGVIGNSILAFLHNPHQLKLLRERPELAENAVEECLRYEGTIRNVSRIASEDIEIGGALIQRGTSVIFDLAAANRDPAMFPNPDQLDITRKNAKQHVAFSQGIHYCLGAALARLEIKSFIKAIAQYDLSLVPNGFKWRASRTFRTLEKLEVVFKS